MNCSLIAALTADGFIGRDEQHNSTRWTSQEDAAWFTKKSTEAGVVVMGNTTFQTIGRGLPGRAAVVYTRTPDEAKLVENQDSLEKGEVYHTQAKPEDLLSQLKELGFDEVAIAGGASIYTLFVKAGLVNKMYLTHEAVFFGKGIPLFDQSLDLKPQLDKIHELSKQTLVFEYSL